jgi:predicted RNA-binding Zn ribbon-like protein
MVETEKGKYETPLDLKEGWLCLDFANTTLWHASDHPTERLNSYADLISWAQHKGILTEHEISSLLRRAERHPKAAGAVLDRVITLRETIYRIFSAVAHGHPPKAGDLAVLNDALSRAMAQLQIKRVIDGFSWHWSGGQNALDRMIWPVVRSAVDLLTSEALDRVGECAAVDRGCGWLFLDQSKNHSRRWCDMAYCGNRIKVLRFHERRRKPRRGKLS